MTLAEWRELEHDVYAPAEDSRLLATTVLDDLDVSGRILDVGTGAGYVASRLAADTTGQVVGADLNPHACQRARRNGVSVVRMDLTSGFRSNTFAAVVFNPPYLPVDEAAEWDDWFELAISGGDTGRAVIERFLDDVGRVLRADGVVYLLVSTYTGVSEVVEYAGRAGFSAVALADASYPGETLTVLKLLR